MSLLRHKKNQKNDQNFEIEKRVKKILSKKI